MPMSSEMLLEACANVRTMLLGAPQLPKRLSEAFQRSSYDGTPLWLVWAVGTAPFGIVIGLGTYKLLSRCFRDRFRGIFKADNLTRADKLSYLMARGLLILISNGVMFAIAILVAVVLDFEHEPARMTIFITVATYACYRILRYVFLLNFFAPDLSTHRMIALDDQRARRLYNDLIYLIVFSAYVLGFVAWAHGLGIDEWLLQF